ncbi:MAG TPA: hypothetical protein VMF10_03465 [Candidatus Aquilonibacter sp.]|nr:hypothetical protein [Candidatus Aquilonibacter sp.]
MSVSSVLMFPPSTESQDEPAVVRPAQAASRSISGRDSLRESDGPEIDASPSNAAQDEVKVQMEPPGEIAVYQFLNQYGNVILQVPPQQVLDLAQSISKELAQEAAPQAVPIEKGEDHGR